MNQSHTWLLHALSKKECGDDAKELCTKKVESLGMRLLMYCIDVISLPQIFVLCFQPVNHSPFLD